MSDPTASPAAGEMEPALFEHLVHHLASMAALLLGAQPHPETGERVEDLDGARLFIDQLEMLASKTRGNLTRAEEQFLQQTLTGLRMLFVQLADRPPEAKGNPAAPAPPTAPEEGESAKRFTKKY